MEPEPEYQALAFDVGIMANQPDSNPHPQTARTLVIRDEERQAREAHDDAEAAKLAVIRINRPRAVIGYNREGRPVYDDDPHKVANWGADPLR